MHSVDGIFVRRALLFLREVRAGRLPTARWLAEQEEVADSTARRSIDKLRYEMGAPLKFDRRRRGWVLTADWWFEGARLAGRRETAALLLALQVGSAVADPEVDRLREQVLLRLSEQLRASPSELEQVVACFGAQRTDVAGLREAVVLDAVLATVAKRELRIEYRSPWAEPGETAARVVQPLRVYHHDGACYLDAQVESGQVRSFHLSFVSRLEETGEERQVVGEVCCGGGGYGVWAGGQVVGVVVRIGEPGARYYAAQQWHAEQRDEWDGATLVRCLPASVKSPELVRRLVSLGDALVGVEPDAVRREVLRVAGGLVERLGGEGEGDGGGAARGTRY